MSQKYVIGGLPILRDIGKKSTAATNTISLDKYLYFNL